MNSLKKKKTGQDWKLRDRGKQQMQGYIQRNAEDKAHVAKNVSDISFAIILSAMPNIIISMGHLRKVLVHFEWME